MLKQRKLRRTAEQNLKGGENQEGVVSSLKGQKAEKGLQAREQQVEACYNHRTGTWESWRHDRSKAPQSLRGHGQDLVFVPWVPSSDPYTYFCGIISVLSHAPISPKCYQIKPHSPVSLSSSTWQSICFQIKTGEWGTMEKQWVHLGRPQCRHRLHSEVNL